MHRLKLSMMIFTSSRHFHTPPLKLYIWLIIFRLKEIPAGLLTILKFIFDLHKFSANVIDVRTNIPVHLRFDSFMIYLRDKRMQQSWLNKI